MEIRKYSVSDDVLIEHTGRTLGNLDEDLPAFENFDSDLNEEKKSELDQCYEAALCFGTDRSERSKLKQQTDMVIEAMGACNQLFVEIRYFARKAFKKRPAILRQFGINEYSKVRKSQSKMVLFMHELVETVGSYKTELIEANLKESVIAALKPATERLTEVNTIQENTKDKRVVKTADRKNLLNKLYDLLLEFSDASEHVFINDQERRNRYALPHNSGSASDEAI